MEFAVRSRHVPVTGQDRFWFWRRSVAAAERLIRQGRECVLHNSVPHRAYDESGYIVRHGRIVVITHPHTEYKIWRIPYGPSIPIIIRRTGFYRDVVARKLEQVVLAQGRARDRVGENIVYFLRDICRQYLGADGLAVVLYHISVLIGYF